LDELTWFRSIDGVSQNLEQQEGVSVVDDVVNIGVGLSTSFGVQFLDVLGVFGDLGVVGVGFVLSDIDFVL
jgi:hypothetical protein